LHRNCEIIGVASGWGAHFKGCEDGPECLYKKVALKSCKVEQKYLWEILYPLFQEKHHKHPPDQLLSLITELNCHLSQAVVDCLKKDYFPIVVGGDHSMALGTWSGVKKGLSGKHDKLGLIWIDARMDANITGVTTTFDWDSVPLAALLGCGDPSIFPRDVKAPIFLPDQICLIGVRKYESAEKELLERMKVKVFYMEDLKSKGFAEVMQEAVETVSRNSSSYGVTLDMAVMDPKEAPGVADPVSGGIVSTELFKMLNIVMNDPKLKAFEIAEFNPHRDRDERTACICLEILGRIIGHGKPLK